MKTKQILAAALILSVMLLLAGCGKSHSLTMTLSDCGEDHVEVFVTVLDKNGKNCGGGNLASDGGSLMVAVPNGTYKVTVDSITYDGAGIYTAFGEQSVTVKGDTQFIVAVDKSVELMGDVAPAA